MSEDRPPALRLEARTDSGKLLAHFDPLGQPCPLDRDSLLGAIAAAGCGDWFALDEALARFANLAVAAEQPFFLEVAERRDGRCELTVADDAMSASLTVVAPRGGAAVTRDQVEQALRGGGVVSGVLDAEIDRALAEGGASGVRVARGRAAEAGTPAQFHSLIPAMQKRGPRMNARGVVDYRELSSLVIVKAGDPLMRRTPATPGRAGEDVLGLVIPAQHGAETPFSPTLSGAEVSADDPDLLLAAIAGQPLLLPDGVSVEPTITLPVVDLGTGNIDFDGTVNITGDIEVGMRVRASGDVFVSGSLEAATIDAGGNIAVLGGVIGHSEAQSNAARAEAQRAHLLAKGSISLRFCENATVEAGTDLLIEEVALHSELTALNQILIGKPGGRKSQLIGGHARATARLQVGILGSAGGIRTYVQVGYQPHAQAQLAAAQRALEANEHKQDELKKVLAYIESGKASDHLELREKAQRTLAACELERLELDAQLAGLQAELVLTEHAHVLIGQAVHPGAEVQIGTKVWRASEPVGPGALKLHEEQIEFGNP